MTRRAVVFVGPRRLESRSIEVDRPGPGEVLVQVLCCTVCESDRRTYRGERSGPTPSILGHEVVGEVVATGGEVSARDGAPLKIGDRVTWSVVVSCGSCSACANGLPQKCAQLFKYGHGRFEPGAPAGGFCSHVLLRPGTSIHRVPTAMADQVASMASCAGATAAAILRLGADEWAGRSVIVQGLGMLGLLAAGMAAEQGADVRAIDPSTERRGLASDLGVTRAAPPCDFETLLEDLSGGADVVIEASGADDALRLVPRLVRTGGSVVYAGTVAPSVVQPFSVEDLVRRMLTIRGVHNYAPQDLDRALAWLAERGDSLAPAFGAPIGLEHLHELLETGPNAALRVAVHP